MILISISFVAVMLGMHPLAALPSSLREPVAAAPGRASPGQSGCNGYEAPASSQDQRNIRFIVTTLSDKSLIELWSYQGALESAGARTKHVHPLRFLAVIFTDPRLTQAMRNIKGKSMVWNRFVDGLGQSMSAEARKGTLNRETVDEFAREVRVDPRVLMPYFQRQDWSGFIGALTRYAPGR